MAIVDRHETTEQPCHELVSILESARGIQAGRGSGVWLAVAMYDCLHTRD